MKNTISELKNRVEGIKSRRNEADQISELEDKVEKTPRKSKQGKKIQKEWIVVKGNAGQNETE